MAHSPYLHTTDVQSLSAVTNQITKSVGRIFSIVTRTFIDILVDPQFKVFLVSVAPESESSAFIKPLIWDVVEPEVLIVPIAHVSRVKVYLGMQSEYKTREVALVVRYVANGTILVASKYVVLFLTLPEFNKKYEFFSEWWMSSTQGPVYPTICFSRMWKLRP